MDHDRTNMPPGPEVIGQDIILTVSNADRSAAWYRNLLGWREGSRHVQPDGHVRQVCLTGRRSGLHLCLVDHRSGPGAFDESRAGLDHLEFLVADRSDLDIWAARLDDLGIPHSGIKEPSYTSNSMITFRDPDNIQLEFFWAAP
jgi:glyoxylase I family protein